MSVSALVDFETLASNPAHACGMNDIADCRILLGRATALDLFADLPLTGNFVLVNAVDGTTVAGGVITWVQTGAAAVGDNVLVLDRARSPGSAPISANPRRTRPNSSGVRRRWQFCYARRGFRF
ncbi:hypothetical protein AUC71_08095 [Methyloceanibacter marginalis]|uniref:GTP-eEF1A C-terminal domain-containing protein n=1 Tax=Methyloceanibacter marginalis TaxID=1774971 RepID=A0A1E3WD19_9HYPH|nr:hypothetical protein [Methyloceanibacter marginalis]ODS03724.1 hypothetical protein AUC71_08095 [Methyloceanibacter marginalis]